MPDKRTDDIRAFFGHVYEVAARSRRKFNSIYDTLLEMQKKMVHQREEQEIGYLMKHVRDPRCLQHG